jgi:two-component system, OmpR family, sensor histidine kinase ChvG
VFLPTAGFLYLDVYERELLDAQERAMVQQGRHLAAALSEQGDLSRELAVGLLDRLDRRTEARLRIVGRDGTLLADSATMGPRRDSTPPDSRDSSLSPGTG